MHVFVFMSTSVFVCMHVYMYIFTRRIFIIFILLKALHLQSKYKIVFRSMKTNLLPAFHTWEINVWQLSRRFEFWMNFYKLHYLLTPNLTSQNFYWITKIKFNYIFFSNYFRKSSTLIKSKRSGTAIKVEIFLWNYRLL